MLAILLGGGTWSGTAMAWVCIQVLALLVTASVDAWVTGFRWVVFVWWALAGASVAFFLAGL